MHCEFEDGGLFSAFDPAFPLDLSLTVGPESKELPIHQTHIMTIGGNPKEERFAFKSRTERNAGIKRSFPVYAAAAGPAA